MPREIPMSDFMGFCVDELISPSDVSDILPGCMGVYFTGPESGAIYFRNPNTGLAFSPNKVDAQTVIEVQNILLDRQLGFTTAAFAVLKNVTKNILPTMAGLPKITDLQVNPNGFTLDATPSKSVNVFADATDFNIKMYDTGNVSDLSVFAYKDQPLYSMRTIADVLNIRNGRASLTKKVGVKNLTDSDFATLVTTYANINFIKIQIPSDYNITLGVILEGGFTAISKPADVNTTTDKQIFIDSATGTLWVGFAKATTKIAIDALLRDKKMLYGLTTFITYNELECNGAVRTFNGETTLLFETLDVATLGFSGTVLAIKTTGSSLRENSVIFEELWKTIENIEANVGIKITRDFFYAMQDSKNVNIGEFNPYAFALRNGKRLFNDEDFLLGNNSVITLGGAAVSLLRTDDVTSPTKSKKVLKFTHTTAATNPDLGGFHASFNTRMNATNIHAFTARLPIGLKFSANQNVIDNMGTISFLGSPAGTGKYETYVVLYQAGDDISNAMGKITIIGDKNTIEPFTWNLAASQVFDVTDYSEEFLLLSDVVTTATANKVLRMNASGTMDVSVTGNSATASKLLTARAIALSGDASGTINFDGSGNVTIPLLLANTGVAAGIYRSVTVDTKGRITAGSNPETLSGYGITDAFSMSLITAANDFAVGIAANTMVKRTLAETKAILGIPVAGVASLTDIQTFTNKTLTDPVFNGSIEEGKSYVRKVISLPAFTTTVANEKVKVSIPLTTTMAGSIILSLCGSWVNSNNSGTISKRIAVHCATNVLNSQLSSYICIDAGSKFAISDAVFTAGKLEFTISKLNSSHDGILILIAEFQGYSGLADFRNISAGAIYTTDVSIPATPVLQSNGFTVWTAENFNPATKLDATSVAASAAKLQTPRTISIGGDATGSATFDGSGNISIPIVVADDSHMHTLASLPPELGEGSGQIKWVASATIGKWSRLCAHAAAGMCGNNFILNISHTRESIIYNNSFLISITANAPGLGCTIVQLGSSQYSTFDLRIAYDPATCASYIDIMDAGVGTGLITVNCSVTVLAAPGSTLTKCTVFTDDTTLPANFTTTKTISVSTIAGAFKTDNFVGALTGNASTATKLLTPRAIAVSGDATGTVNFDGSANIAIPLVLASSGVAAGTFRSVTVDIKGRVTAGSNPTTLVGYGITDAYSKTSIDGNINQDVRTTASPTFVSPIMTSLKIGTWEVKQNGDGSLGLFKN